MDAEFKDEGQMHTKFDSFSKNSILQFFGRTKGGASQKAEQQAMVSDTVFVPSLSQPNGTLKPQLGLTLVLTQTGLTEGGHNPLLF